MNTVVEICVGSIEGAITAQEAGADRIELNAALSLGGLTPSIGLVQSVLLEVDIPVVVMLRPRESGFCYSDAEFGVMRRDLDALLDCGVAGIAFGLLREDRAIDVERCQKLLSQFGSQSPVFHRAFDVVADPIDAAQQLAGLGVQRIMTSGQAPKAVEGVELIRQLVEQESHVEILVAGGVRSHNVAELIERTGCNQVHAAQLSERTDASMVSNISFSGQRANREQFYSQTNGQSVREFVAAVLART